MYKFLNNPVSPRLPLKTRVKAILAELLGYNLVVTTPEGNWARHYSFTYADALAWANCYPHDDKLVIRRGWSVIASRGY